jgi:hypothetical protein
MLLKLIQKEQEKINESTGETLSRMIHESLAYWRQLEPLQRIQLTTSAKRLFQETFYSQLLVKKWNKPITLVKFTTVFRNAFTKSLLIRKNI